MEKVDAKEGIEALAAACSSVIEGLAQRQAEFERQALRYISIQDEELNMLWWLQGGRSDFLNLSFSEIPRELRPFVLARELVQVTYAIPGVSAAEALLARASVDDAEPIDITAAVQAVSVDWLKTLVPDERASKMSPVTTPLHEAFKRRLEVDGADTWIPTWAAVCDIEATAKLSPLRLADQCYCEQLIIRK